MCDVCVLCAGRAEVVFEASAGSACGHGACRRCLSAHVEAALPGCLRQWALEVQCPAAGCGRRLPQRLVLSVSAAEKLAAVLDQAVVWPEAGERERERDRFAGEPVECKKPVTIFGQACESFELYILEAASILAFELILGGPVPSLWGGEQHHPREPGMRPFSLR